MSSRERPIASGTPARRKSRFVCEVRPALQFESLLETMFVLAEDGKTNRKGMPNPLRLAVIARAHFDTVRLPQPPAWLQKAGLAIGAPLGRALGYRPTYAPEVRLLRQSPQSDEEEALLLHAAGAGADPAGAPRVRCQGREASDPAGSPLRLVRHSAPSGFGRGARLQLSTRGGALRRRGCPRRISR